MALWCDYLNYVQEHDPSVSSCSIDGISKARNLFERALTAAGLHVAEGGRIWELYRDFEQAILITIDGTDPEVHPFALMCFSSLPLVFDTIVMRTICICTFARTCLNYNMPLLILCYYFLNQ